jgi:hypothetical protein
MMSDAKKKEEEPRRRITQLNICTEVCVRFLARTIQLSGSIQFPSISKKRSYIAAPLLIE